MVFFMGVWFYGTVVNGLLANRYEPPTRWLGPAHAEQPTILQKPGTRSSFLMSHKVSSRRRARDEDKDRSKTIQCLGQVSGVCFARHLGSLRVLSALACARPERADDSLSDRGSRKHRAYQA